MLDIEEIVPLTNVAPINEGIVISCSRRTVGQNLCKPIHLPKINFLYFLLK